MNCDGSDLCLQGIRELGGHKAQNLGGTAGVASSSSYRQMQLTNAKAAMHTHGIRNNPPWVPLSVSTSFPLPCSAGGVSLSPVQSCPYTNVFTLPVRGCLGGIKGREWSANQHLNSHVSFYRRRRGSTYQLDQPTYYQNFE